MRHRATRGRVLTALLAILLGVVIAAIVVLQTAPSLSETIGNHRNLAQQRLERALEETSH